ncbi:MAG: hypothetical protein ABR497_05875, partial [Kiritimatiellia bacterium]
AGLCCLIFVVEPCTRAAAAQKSVKHPERAGRAETAAINHSRQAIVSEWLAGQTSGDGITLYEEMTSLHRAMADHKWRTWQAYHYDDAELLKQAEDAYRQAARTLTALEKTRKQLNLPKPEPETFKAAPGTDAPSVGAERATDHERAAGQHERQAYTHSFRSENRREDFQKYNMTVAETHLALAQQHWSAWRAGLLNDNNVLVLAQANIRTLRARLASFHGERAQYLAQGGAGGKDADNHETLAINHGMRAVKYSQIAIQVNRPLKEIYVELAENYRQSSKLQRDRAHALLTGNQGALPGIDMKIITLHDKRMQLQEREQEGIQLLRSDPDTIDQRKAITQFKKEFRELRERVKQINDSD